MALLRLEPNQALAYHLNIKAEPIVTKTRIVYAEGQFVEVVVWRLPEPVSPSEHPFKYRLVYIVDGVRLIGFDNERGKGDHMHVGGAEKPYQFANVDTLMNDFASAVESWRLLHDENSS